MSGQTDISSAPVTTWLRESVRWARARASIPLGPGSAALAIVLLCLLAFGALIPWLGFYWDDWETILVAKLFPISEFWHYFPDDRPLAGWTYVLFTPLVGTTPIGWHLFSLALRCATVLAMWWVFRALWPHAWRQVTQAALLFAVYPVFFKQPIAVAFHQHWTGYLLYFMSLGAMFMAVRSPRRKAIRTLGSLVAMGLHLAIFEYFAGLELLRPVLLWLILGSPRVNGRERLRKTLMASAPYSIVLLAFAVWRIQFAIAHPTSANPPRLVLQLAAQPLAALQQLAALGFEGSVRILLTGWLRVLQPDLIYPQRRFILVALAVGALAAGALAVYLRSINARARADLPDTAMWRKQALAVGLAAMLLGALPIWLTGGQLLNSLFGDRFGLASMFGASLVWVAGLEWLRHRWRPAALMLSLLIGASVSLHLRIANDYRWSWIEQRAYYWQLYWRAPAIEPATALIADDDFFGYVKPAFSTNLLYSQPRGSRMLPYWFYSARDELRDRPAELRHGVRMVERARQFHFEANSRSSLVLMMPPSPRCLWVLDTRNGEGPEVAPILKGFLSLSDLSRVHRTAPATDYPSQDVFGPEPERGWCYFFEKADLAVQFEDYAEVLRLYHEASEAGHVPSDPLAIPPHEWMPFIRAFLQLGEWEYAEEASLAIDQTDPRYRPVLCRMWEGAPESEMPVEGPERVYPRLVDRLECKGLR